MVYYIYTGAVCFAGYAATSASSGLDGVCFVVKAVAAVTAVTAYDVAVFDKTVLDNRAA